MTPVEISPWEDRQVRLLIKRYGADPSTFRLRKFELPEGGWRVRVSGSLGATTYNTASPGGWATRFADDLRGGLFGFDKPALPPAVAAGLEQARRLLEADGLAAMLAWLNARVPHRFTAVYRRDADAMCNIAAVDKQPQLGPLDLRVVPIEHSFCQFVLRDGLFLTQDSGGDPRLTDHPYCGVMGCYVGVPIQRDGEMLGSLCHFDLESRPLADEEFLLLDQVARLLPDALTALAA